VLLIGVQDAAGKDHSYFSIGDRRNAYEMNEQEIIEGLKPVCICKGIRKSVFLKHIRAGLTTVEALQKATGAGRGSCKGERCTPRIEELIRGEEKRGTGGR
jgi:NAD(P)H-nitrite reductase large subunit